MTRSRRKQTPNYQMMYKSAVTSLQIAYAEYKEARIEAMRWTFIDYDGRMAILNGYEGRQKRIENAESEVVRLMELVNELRYKLGGEDDANKD